MDTSIPGQVHTLTGKTIDLLSINAEDINVWDIVFPLSQQVRYNGQIPVMWDVLSHSVQMWIIANMEGITLTRNETLGILLHDAAEAYMGDLVRPIKYLITKDEGNVWDQLERHINVAISEAFGLDYEHMYSRLVKELDEKALALEAVYFNRPMPQGLNPYDKDVPFTKVKPRDFVDKLKELASPKNPRELYEYPEELAPYLLDDDAQVNNSGRVKVKAEDGDFKHLDVDLSKIRI